MAHCLMLADRFLGGDLAPFVEEVFEAGFAEFCYFVVKIRLYSERLFESKSPLQVRSESVVLLMGVLPLKVVYN